MSTIFHAAGIAGKLFHPAGPATEFTSPRCSTSGPEEVTRVFSAQAPSQLAPLYDAVLLVRVSEAVQAQPMDSALEFFIEDTLITRRGMNP
jgi:hypothetical protein